MGLQPMIPGLSGIIQSQPWLRVIRTLAVVGEPISLREIVDLTELSPGGVREALVRLTTLRILKRTKHGNRHLFTLTLDKPEAQALSLLCGVLEQRLVVRANRRISGRGSGVLDWNQQMLTLIARAK